MSNLIYWLKFQHSLPVGRTLGNVLAHHLLSEANEDPALTWPDVLMPVPLHPTRFHERGFNQATEIAGPISRAIDRPLVTDALFRVAPTLPQSGLDSRAARQANVKHAFHAKRAGVEHKHIAVIDDVLTTGATATAVANELYDAGAARVDIWTVARAAG